MVDSFLVLFIGRAYFLLRYFFCPANLEPTYIGWQRTLKWSEGSWSRNSRACMSFLGQWWGISSTRIGLLGAVSTHELGDQTILPQLLPWCDQVLSEATFNRVPEEGRLPALYQHADMWRRSIPKAELLPSIDHYLFGNKPEELSVCHAVSQQGINWEKERHQDGET